MENNQQPGLVRLNTGLAATGKSSLTSQERSLLSELDLTATNSKTVLEPRIGAEFVRVLGNFPAPAIEAAFRGWRDVSPYFPAVSDIRALCLLWIKRTAEAEEYGCQVNERKQTDAARERGELVNFADIVKQLKTQTHAMPESEHEKRNRHLRALNEIVPAVYMTPEEIAARREREQAEIKRYESNA